MMVRLLGLLRRRGWWWWWYWEGGWLMLLLLRRWWISASAGFWTGLGLTGESLFPGMCRGGIRRRRRLGRLTSCVLDDDLFASLPVWRAAGMEWGWSCLFGCGPVGDLLREGELQVSPPWSKVPFAAPDHLVLAGLLPLLEWLGGLVDLVLRMALPVLSSAYKPNRARRRLGRHCEDREGMC